MTNIRVFKRSKDGWVLRPTGGADMNPGIKPASQAWLKSEFAQRLINKSVGNNDLSLSYCHR